MVSLDVGSGTASRIGLKGASYGDPAIGDILRLDRGARKNSKVAHRMSKRAFDVAAASAALLVLLPLFLLLCVLIPMESRGAPFFSQLRWGMNGRKIRVYKFRSMRSDLGDPSGVAQTTVGDPRVTRLGFWLRKLNIDELPQLINVLKGDMSLVGPRCHPIGMFGGGMLYEDLVPAYHERHAVRPGITGLAQMNGLRGPTTDADVAKARIAHDLEYIRSFSFWLDMRIILGTVLAEMRGGSGF